MKMIGLLKAVCFAALLSVCASQNTRAQGTVYSVNIVGCIPDMTTYLLTAPLTTAQRQLVHARNFNQLTPSARAIYLHAVAFDIGIIVRTGQALTSANLAAYLQEATDGDGFFDVFTLLTTADNNLFNTHKAIVKEAMRELNVLVAGEVASNSAFQQAMEAGAQNSIAGEIDEWNQDGSVITPIIPPG